ncbi:unnamed protein product [Paramecium sonneborni]|uniref:Uncharacterized protein n=1 Tax=Paramecium sonneborni TaxID=65129 RepID=A0A8S1KI13_9CILI|nr:unnamed protein product [Paramecium sonneborni]
MGSYCQKQSEINTDYQESEQIDFVDMKIDQEIHPIRVHKGFRMTPRKYKQSMKIDKAVSLTFLQEELYKYTNENCCSKKNIYAELEQKQENKQNQQNKLKSIIKPHSSFQRISSLKVNYYINCSEKQLRVGQRLHSEKQVRFNIPKQYKKSSHSCSVQKSRLRKTYIR